MAAPFNDLLSKCEAACKSVIDGLALTGVTVNTGLEDESLTLPYVVCYASSSTEEVVDSGLDRVVTEIIIVSDANATTALATHRSRVATIMDTFRDEDISTDLTAAVSDFGVIHVLFREQTGTMEDHKLRNTMILDIICCGSDIS